MGHIAEGVFPVKKNRCHISVMNWTFQSFSFSFLSNIYSFSLELDQGACQPIRPWRLKCAYMGIAIDYNRQMRIAAVC